MEFHLEFEKQSLFYVHCCRRVLLLAARSAIYKSAFYNANFKGFDDWNCGKITTCGDFGSVCGGYGAKGKGSDIKKTFNLPAGKYSVQLDFLRIDSWFVCMML